jgi:predicted RNA-binding protein with RPS1 domain
MAADWGNLGIEEFGNFIQMERSDSLSLVHFSHFRRFGALV